MTLNQITTLIATNLERELDIPFRLQLAERVKYWRSRMIANHLQKNPQQRRHFVQTIYMKMVRGTAASNLFSDASKTETEKPVPQVIKVGTAKYDYVGGADGKSPFRSYNVGTEAFMEESRFYKLFGHYQEVNSTLVTDKPLLQALRVDALFDDPLAALAVCCKCEEEGCDTWNVEFPMSGEMTQLVIQSILQVDYNRKDPVPTPQIELNPKQ